MNKVEDLKKRLYLREKWFTDASKENRRLNAKINSLETQLDRKNADVLVMQEEINKLKALLAFIEFRSK